MSDNKVQNVDLPKGYQLYLFDELPSTNDHLKELADSGYAHKSIVCARSQSKGKGRLGRSWVSAKGNLFISYLFRPDVTLEKAGELSFVASLAVANVLSKFTDKVACKWPNDILINRKKVSGVLLETKLNGENNLEYIVMGIGINLRTNPTDTPYQATNLNDELGGKFNTDLLKIIELLTNEIETVYTIWNNESLSSILDNLRRYMIGIGEKIEIRRPTGNDKGILLNITDKGLLVLEKTNGEIEEISVGDVFWQ